MLAKHIPKDPAIKDSYRALAEYLAAASDEGEKLEHFWITNCNAGKDLDSLDMAIMEVEATQALNARAGPSRAYHLMVSFGTAEQPTEKALQEMEQAFAQALGFEEHQRVCAAHGNTDNFHFHVAYNGGRSPPSLAFREFILGKSRYSIHNAIVNRAYPIH